MTLVEPATFLEVENFGIPEELNEDQAKQKAVRLIFNKEPKFKLIYDFFNDSQIIATDSILKDDVIECSICLKLVTKDRDLKDTTLILNGIALQCECDECTKRGYTVVIPTGHFSSYKKDDIKYNAVLELSGGLDDGTVFSVIRASKDIAKDDNIILRPTVKYA